MIAEERKNKIVELLAEKKTITVKDLTSLLGATGATIRKDLEDLQIQNKLQRVHGGAVSVDKVSEILLDTDLEVRSQEEKRAIALHAYDYIQDNDTLLLDASTTVRELTKLISSGDRKNLTIFTNSLNNATHLSGIKRLRLILIGGEITPFLKFGVGPFAEDFLSKIRVDKCFLGTNGIDKNFGFSIPNIDDANLKRKMTKSSRHTFILADSTKFNKQYLMTFLNFSDPIYALITDDKISSTNVQIYSSLTNLIIAPAISSKNSP